MSPGISVIMVLLLMSCRSHPQSTPVAIAHRGSSGYLPEHTLAAKAMAHAMGVDFIEQDVVLTRDDQPIVLHDIHLDTVTDVAHVFPGRARADGRYYAIDFTLAEIRQLAVHERISLETGRTVYPERFPLGLAHFRVPTLAEELELIEGLNRSTGRPIGIYPEIKAPAWHRDQGKDPSVVVLDTLAKHDYRKRDDRVWIQCFDPAELKRIRHELGCRLRMVQLIAPNAWKEADTDFDHLRTPEGLREVATYADAIGPWLEHLMEPAEGRWKSTGLVEAAHAAGLAVHPYTARRDDLPPWCSSMDELLTICFDRLAVDGLFSDFPDLVVRFLRSR